MENVKNSVVPEKIAHRNPTCFGLEVLLLGHTRKIPRMLSLQAEEQAAAAGVGTCYIFHPEK